MENKDPSLKFTSIEQVASQESTDLIDEDQRQYGRLVSFNCEYKFIMMIPKRPYDIIANHKTQLDRQAIQKIIKLASGIRKMGYLVFREMKKDKQFIYHPSECNLSQKVEQTSLCSKPNSLS
ncbi:unnamed protein product [Moneuplotes crassus]|uniref:Uncharacterized protein n=1 Tax=Euplotes crassus TaxID=5936 RepID=A0AAD1XC58_EUPCR|nr:unnamed protein product [Moneuplotes crassus]